MRASLLSGLMLLIALPGCSNDSGTEDAQVVAEENDIISTLAVDATHIYFASGFYIGGGPVQRIPKGGGERDTFGEGAEFATSLRLSGGTAYWVDSTTDKVTYAAKDRSRFGRYPQPGPLPLALGLDGQTLYFSAEPEGRPEQGSIFRMTDTATGSAVAIASAQNDPVALEADDTHLYWVNHGTYPAPDGALMRVSKTAGGAPQVVLGDLTGPSALAMDGEFVYVSVTGPDDETVSGAVLRVSKLGGAADLLAEVQAPYELAVEGDRLYVATAGGVLRLSLDSGESRTTGPGPSRHVATDAGFVYFDADRFVYRLAKD